MQTYKELVKKHKERNSKQKTGWRYEPWGDSNTERIDIAEGGRVGFGDGGITLITRGPNTGKYHLRLGGGREGRQTYYGTKAELQKIFNERPKPGGDRFLRLEGKKYDKNWLTKKQFLKFLSDNNIKAETAPSFSKNHGIKTKVNPLQKNTYLYNISQLTPEKINTIQKKQVKVGQGTAIAREKFPPIPKQHFVEKRAIDIKEKGGTQKGGIFEGSRSIHKGHLRDYKKSLITGETLAYTPEKINVKMGRSLDHKIRRVTEKIDKTKKQKLPFVTDGQHIKTEADRIRLLSEKDAILTRMVEKSAGYKQAQLSTGYMYGQTGKPTVDPLNMFPGRTEQQINDFVKKYKNKKAVPGVTPQSEIDNIVKANIFERNRQATFEAAKARAFEDVEKFNKNQLIKLCPNKASGGRVGMKLAGSAGVECGKSRLRQVLTKGGGTQTELNTIRQIFKTSGGLLKGFVDPRQWIKLSNLLGPEAMAFYAAIEAGHITHDVINKGTPIKQALGSNWATKWAMPRTLLEYQLEDIRKKGKLDTPALKIWGGGQELLAEYDRLVKTQAAFKDQDETLGPIVGSMNIDEKIAQKEKEIMDYLKKHKTSLGMFDPGSAAEIEFQNRQTEAEATRLAKTGDIGETDPFVLDVSAAKKPYKPMFGFKDEFEPKVTRPGTRVGPMTAKDKIKVDYTRPTYKTMTEEPVTKEDIIKEQKWYGLRPEERLEYFDDKDTGVNLAEALRLKKKWPQAMFQPGMLGTQDEFSTGGRVPFKTGGMGRRAFLGWLASMVGGIAGIKSGLVKFGIGKGKGKVAIKVGDHIIQSTPGMPDWYIPLVNRIVSEGKDVTAKLGTKSREAVHTKKIGPNEEVTVYHDLDTGNVRVNYGTKNAADELTLEYKAPEVIESGKYRGDKTKSEFSAKETEPEVVNWEGDIEWSGENIVENVDDLITDTSKLKQFGTKKKLNIKDRLKAEKKRKYHEKLETDTMEQIDYIENKQGYYIDDMLDEGKRVGDFDPKGYDTHNLWKGQNLPKEYNERAIRSLKEHLKKTKKASGGRVYYDNYLPGIDEI